MGLQAFLRPLLSDQAATKKNYINHKYKINELRTAMILFNGSKHYLQWRIPGGGFDTSNRASHNETVATDPTIPLWANPLNLHIFKPRLFKPFNIFFFLWKQHPHVCKETRQPKRWINRTD
ncbi:hypothetical protein Hanom_Chr01g00007461 [Helianthus anomalus]